VRADDEEMPPEAIAVIIHEAHRGLQQWLEDTYPSQPWAPLEDWHRGMIINRVRLIQQGFPREYVQQIWVDIMTEMGWEYGKVKDPIAKTHPNMKPWGELPWWEQQKMNLAYVITERMTQGKS
jgi:hypothetical protein